MGSAIRLRRQRQRDAMRYRLLRVELTEYVAQLRARADQPAGQLMLPGPVADRLQRMLDRGGMDDLLDG